MPLVIGLTVLCQKIARNIYRLYRTRLTDINTFLSEHLSGMKIIQIFGRQERKFEEFHDKNTKLYKAFYREMLMYAVFLSLIHICMRQQTKTAHARMAYAALQRQRWHSLSLYRGYCHYALR